MLLIHFIIPKECTNAIQINKLTHEDFGELFMTFRLNLWSWSVYGYFVSLRSFLCGHFAYLFSFFRPLWFLFCISIYFRTGDLDALALHTHAHGSAASTLSNYAEDVAPAEQNEGTVADRSQIKLSQTVE